MDFNWLWVWAKSSVLVSFLGVSCELLWWCYKSSYEWMYYKKSFFVIISCIVESVRYRIDFSLMYGFIVRIWICLIGWFWNSLSCVSGVKFWGWIVASNQLNFLHCGVGTIQEFKNYRIDFSLMYGFVMLWDPPCMYMNLCLMCWFWNSLPRLVCVVCNLGVGL